MARNAEKAMTTLARWRAAQLEGGDEKQKHMLRRPYLASECNDLQQCNKWRLQIIREIARKVSQIQNAGLGEFRIRDLNDEINKLIREKGHWESQIKDLGGPDYAAVGPRMLDNEGREVPGNRGYKYFGAARQLPGVRELFENAPPPLPRKTRGELIKFLDADYYGYRDDEDGILAPLEAAEETKAVAKDLAKWAIKKEKKMAAERENDEEDSPDEENATGDQAEAESDEGVRGMVVKSSIHEDTEEEDDRRDKYIAYVPVPSQKEIEIALLNKRKRELLQTLSLTSGHLSMLQEIDEDEHNEEDESVSRSKVTKKSGTENSEKEDVSES